MGEIKTFELRPYQAQILEELSPLSSLGLFLGTGTGKTLTSLFRSNENPTENLLIVCPHNVLGQWKAVINTYYPKYNVLEFKKSWSSDKKNIAIKNNKTANCIIVNYEILYKLNNLNLIINDNWTIILDESHRIKDASVKKYKNKDGSYKKEMTRVTAAALRLGELTPWKIILTATPTQGNYGGYIDLWSQLKFLGYIDYPLSTFKSRYVVYQKQQIWGTPYPIFVITGYKFTEEIDKLLRLSCRYYKSKFNDFEPQHNKIDIERCSKYNKVKRERVYKDIILNNSPRKRIGLKTLTTGTIMGKDLYKNDFTYEDNTNKIDWIKDFLKDTDETVAIYYQYNVELHNLEKMLKALDKTYIVINGKTKDPYHEINNKEYDVMLGQFQSASESLDGLQHKCHIMIFYAMPESSLKYTQSIGRINRDGQTQVPMYYYLVMEKTIDKDIWDMIQEKVEFSTETLERLMIDE